MPIQVPDLDTLRFQDLVDTAKRALPELAPDWTDHNVSDPGVTLIESAAEQVDRLSFRLNRVPVSHLHGLLRLLGVTPMPAAPVRARVAIKASSAGRASVPVGTPLATADPDVFFIITAAAEVDGGEDAEVVVEAVLVEHLGARRIGTSAADPGQPSLAQRGQRFALGRDPVSPALWGDDSDSLTVIVQGSNSMRWVNVLSFAGAGGSDACYTWNPVTREIVFGPEVETEEGGPLLPLGGAPEAGSAILVDCFATTEKRPSLRSSGEDFPDVTFSVQGPLFGGASYESAEAALRRIAFGLNPVQRATSLRDYEIELARRLPTLRRVFARYEPSEDFRRLTPISVYAVPDTEGLGRPQLLPDVMRQRLGKEAETLRLIGSAVSVKDADYHGFGIVLSVRFLQGESRADLVEKAIREGLAQYFHPLLGGETGDGWPWGRSINIGDVYYVLDSIPDIHAVTAVEFTEPPGGSSVSRILLGEQELPYLDPNSVRVTITP